MGGAVGQGKSNLLLDIIYSLAADYPPTELELLLLDFKRGLEFKRFDADETGEGWLPHVKVLSLESNQEFGLAVLRHVGNELQRRSQVFKEIGVNSITEYRSKTGAEMPRQVLIIDEFHILFEGDDDLVDQAVEYLEILAKQGRAYGIHLLLASQTTSAISGLRLKGDSIFAQFPLRMSLKNTAQESEAVLAQHNRAAADLTYRGEVILNRNFGSDPTGSNIRGIAAWVDSERFAGFQRQLWQQGHGERPLTFLGGDFSSWDLPALRALTAVDSDLIPVWLGRPVEITDQPVTVELDEDTDQAIAIVGNDDVLATNTLTAAMLSAVCSTGGNARFVLLCGLNRLPQPVEKVVEFARRQGVEIELIDRREIAQYLVTKVGPALGELAPQPAFFFGIGMQRVPGMGNTFEAENSLPVDGEDLIPAELSFGDLSLPTTGFGVATTSTPNTAREVLALMATEGAVNRQFLIGWWSTMRSLNTDLGFDGAGVGTYVFAKVGLDDLRSVAGVLARLPADYPRTGVFSCSSDRGLVSTVPFQAPNDELLGALG